MSEIHLFSEVPQGILFFNGNMYMSLDLHLSTILDPWHYCFNKLEYTKKSQYN